MGKRWTLGLLALVGGCAKSCNPEPDVCKMPAALPPDPAAMAGPTDPTGPTNLADAVAFLYMAHPPVQPGVAAGAIDRLRASVLRGAVEDRSGAALAGVPVSVLGHPELGATLSRGDGRF